MNLIVKTMLWLMAVKHSNQFVFPDMIIERDSNKDLVTSARNKDMGKQRKGTGRDMVANSGITDIADNTMGVVMDSNSEELEKDTVSLNRTSPVRAQYKNGEKNLLRNDFSSLNFIEDQPVCGNGTDFCSDPIAYPSKAIRKALRKQKRVIKSMFDTDLFRLRFRSGIDLYQGGENVCSMSTTHIMPKAARNKKGQFKFLVNGGEGSEDYIQLVKISQCLGAGEACGKGKIFTREVTECRQEYADHKLVALDEEGKELIVDTFSFPSCCSCIMQTGLEL